MAKNIRLENAVGEFLGNIERLKVHDKFQLQDDTITIRNNRPESWSTVLYLMFLILLPVGGVVYYYFFDKDYSNIFWLLIIIIWFTFNFIKMVRGKTLLMINLKDKYLQVDNVDVVFKNFVSRKIVYFDDIAKTNLKQKDVASRVRIEWNQLSLLDRKGREHILIDFKISSPESTMAMNVKTILDTSRTGFKK